MEAGYAAVQKFEFLENGRKLAQAAIQFALAQDSVKTVLPNFTRSDQIKEFCAASDLPALTGSELKQIRTLWDDGLRESLDQPFSNSQTKPTPRPASASKV